MGRQLPRLEAAMREDAFGLGERCVVRWKRTIVGEHGEEECLRSTDIFRARDGLIREWLSYARTADERA